MLNVIRTLLLKIIEIKNQIDFVIDNISSEEALEVAKVLASYTDKEIRLSKYQACRYLNMSRATFDNYVRYGKLPKGEKQQGFKELSWKKKDLDEFIHKRK